MNVLFVNDYGFLRGGAEVLVEHERSELEARGHSTALLSLDSPSLYGPAEDWPRPFEDPIPRVPSLWHQLRHARARRALELAVRQTEPDLIHYHTLTRLGPDVMLSGNGAPAVVTLHDYALMYPRLRSVRPEQPFCDVGEFACCPRHAGLSRYAFESVRTAIHRRLLRRAGRVLVPSEYMRSVASACGIERVRVCANGLPDAPRAARSDGRLPQVLFVGRVEREKGVFPLVEAFELLADRVDAAELRIVGNGAELGPLGERIRLSRHAARIRLPGALPVTDLPSAYAAARVVAVPSLWPEPFGLAGLEAMQAGTPVVGSGRGGMTEWLRDGINGICVDPLDVPAFSRALETVVSDDTLFARLAEGGWRTAQQFTIARHVDCLEAVYREVCESALRD